MKISLFLSIFFIFKSQIRNYPSSTKWLYSLISCVSYHRSPIHIHVLHRWRYFEPLSLTSYQFLRFELHFWIFQIPFVTSSFSHRYPVHYSIRDDSFQLYLEIHDIPFLCTLFLDIINASISNGSIPIEYPWYSCIYYSFFSTLFCNIIIATISNKLRPHSSESRSPGGKRWIPVSERDRDRALATHIWRVLKGRGRRRWKRKNERERYEQSKKYELRSRCMDKLGMKKSEEVNFREFENWMNSFLSLDLIRYVN